MNHLSYQSAARILTVASGLLFASFSFVYLYFFQRDVIGALHFSLSHGKTHYSPLAGALIITLVLLLLRWGVNSLLGLKGPVRALAYFPSFLLLGVLTDVDGSLFHGGSIEAHWAWLLPLVLLIFLRLGFSLRRMFRNWLNREDNILHMVNVNLGILIAECLLTVSIGNTQINFHHELAVEQAIRSYQYAAALQVGAHSPYTSHTLNVLRAYALSLNGSLGEQLFTYPQPYGVRGLLFDHPSPETLRTTADSLYTYLGARPHFGEQPMQYLTRLCQEEAGSHTALDYYLCGLLLDKQLDRFAAAIDTFCFHQDTLPRHYHEALLLYRQQHPSYSIEISDSLSIQRLNDMLKRRGTYANLECEKQEQFLTFGDTYWWYYLYQ